MSSFDTVRPERSHTDVVRGVRLIELIADHRHHWRAGSQGFFQQSNLSSFLFLHGTEDSESVYSTLDTVAANELRWSLALVAPPREDIFSSLVHTIGILLFKSGSTGGFRFFSSTELAEHDLNWVGPGEKTNPMAVHITVGWLRDNSNLLVLFLTNASFCPRIQEDQLPQRNRRNRSKTPVVKIRVNLCGQWRCRWRECRRNPISELVIRTRRVSDTRPSGDHPRNPTSVLGARWVWFPR